MGEVHEGTAKMDYLPEERERGITITAAATTIAVARPHAQPDRHARATWTSRPRSSAACACSTARSSCSTRVTGVEAQSETVWRQADALPRAARSASSTSSTAPAPTSSRRCDSIRDAPRRAIAAVALPARRGGTLRGHRSTSSRARSLRFTRRPGPDGRARAGPGGARATRSSSAARELVEAAADHDDDARRALPRRATTLDARRAARGAPRGARSRRGSSRCSAARRSATSASSRCSTPSSTTSRARSTSAPVDGPRPDKPEKAVAVAPDPDGAARRARLQDRRPTRTAT